MFKLVYWSNFVMVNIFLIFGKFSIALANSEILESNGIVLDLQSLFLQHDSLKFILSNSTFLKFYSLSSFPMISKQRTIQFLFLTVLLTLFWFTHYLSSISYNLKKIFHKNRHSLQNFAKKPCLVLTITSSVDSYMPWGEKFAKLKKRCWEENHENAGIKEET